jgi:RNA polymerase sigma-70 factor (ECF subfamily)
VKIVAGETALYEILIRRYNPYLYKIGRSYNYNHEDTQDLMQETFVSAYFGLPDFENRAAFKTWIFKIMLNNCYHKRQKASFKNEIDFEIGDNTSPLFSTIADTGKTVMNKELNSVIERALTEIPETYRMVFTLREISGLNLAETAAVLDISQTNVKVRLNRAKAMLRQEIEKFYSKEEIFEFNLIYCDAVVENVMGRIGELTAVSR